MWPLWGTCLGHELISVLAAGPSKAVLSSGFDSDKLPSVVNWTAAASSSRFFSDAAVRDSFAAGALAMENHVQGVTPEAFETYLSGAFLATSTMVDRKGKPYISSMEGLAGLPVYTTQWHPEKAMYEWPSPDVEFIPHGFSAVLANHWIAAKFVSEAAKNKRRFASEKALYDALIYNFAPRHNGITSEFMQQYFFPAV